MADKHVCMPENAPKMREWLATRGGLAIWRSHDLSDPGQTWTTPVRNADGLEVTAPHWKCGGVGVRPERIITDPAEVVVQVPRLLEEVTVTVRRQGMKLVLSKHSEAKLEKKVAKHREDLPGKAVWYVTGDLMFPSCSIYVADREVPLMEYEEVPT